MVQLQLIKPKTLPDNKFAYLEKEACVLDFGTSRVLMPNGTGVDYQPAVISIKDLFNMDLDNATGIGDSPRPSIVIPDLDWKTIPINLVDVGVFNAVASAGDSIFWHGKISINNKSWSARIAGFIYYLDFKMPKILDWAPEELEFCIDYNVCYYINQMFKGVTKTKPRTLKIAWDKNNLYMQEDSDECPYYVIVPRSVTEYEEKNKSFGKVSELYSNREEQTNYSQVDRKSFVKDKDSLYKHLLKAVGDTPQYISTSIADKYQNEMVKLWINKKKQK